MINLFVSEVEPVANSEHDLCTNLAYDKATAVALQERRDALKASTASFLEDMADPCRLKLTFGKLPKSPMRFLLISINDKGQVRI